LFLSAQLAYQLSIRFGRALAVRLAGEDSLDAAAEWFSKAGGACVAVSRCLPVLSEAIACLAGLSRFSQRDFFVAALLGALPAGFVFALIGHLGHRDSTTATALGAIVPVLLWLTYRRISRKTPATRPANVP
jgi:membrane protein DedA with SNARE-associated domain